MFTDEAKQMCFICLPSLLENYKFVKNIGKGSQAYIALVAEILARQGAVTAGAGASV